MVLSVSSFRFLSITLFGLHEYARPAKSASSASVSGVGEGRTFSLKNPMGYGKDYKYAHDFPLFSCFFGERTDVLADIAAPGGTEFHYRFFLFRRKISLFLSDGRKASDTFGEDGTGAAASAASDTAPGFPRRSVGGQVGEYFEYEHERGIILRDEQAVIADDSESGFCRGIPFVDGGDVSADRKTVSRENSGRGPDYFFARVFYENMIIFCRRVRGDGLFLRSVEFFRKIRYYPDIRGSPRRRGFPRR